MISIDLENVRLELGNGTQTFVTVTIATGRSSVLNTGIAASVTASIQLSSSLSTDFQLNTGTITFELNTTTADVQLAGVTVTARTLRVRVTGASISVLGQSLAVGEFTFEQTTTHDRDEGRPHRPQRGRPAARDVERRHSQSTTGPARC